MVHLVAIGAAFADRRVLVLDPLVKLTLDAGNVLLEERARPPIFRGCI
jgi:hypothetical protein